MLTDTIQDMHSERFGRHEEITKRGRSSALRSQRLRYPQSAPATRYPLGVARNSLNENLTTLPWNTFSINKSCSNILLLVLISNEHAQFNGDCENFGKSVNKYKTRNPIQSHVDIHKNSIGDKDEEIPSDSRRRIRSLPNSPHFNRNPRTVNNENLRKKGIGGPTSISPIRKARSLGRLTSSKGFASSLDFNNKLPKSIKLHHSELSSFFEIESEDTSELAEESPILYNDIQATITSPHCPPFLLPRENNMRKNIKQNALFSHNNVSLTTTDYFQDYMEERMARWRPGQSQFNVDDTMDGKHPYQQENFELDPKAAKTNAYNPFATLKAWFNGKVAIFDLENQKQSIKNSLENKDPNEQITDIFETQIPEISKRLKKIDFKINSSNSIISKPFKPGECSNAANVLRNSTTQQELTTIDEPSYTPKALPFNDYDLNFETKDYFSNHKTERGSNAIVDSMDEDIRDLLNGFDNFFSDCFRSLWNTCSSTGKMCFNST